MCTALHGKIEVTLSTTDGDERGAMATEGGKVHNGNEMGRKTSPLKSKWCTKPSLSTQGGESVSQIVPVSKRKRRFCAPRVTGKLRCHFPLQTGTNGLQWPRKGAKCTMGTKWDAKAPLLNQSGAQNRRFPLEVGKVAPKVSPSRMENDGFVHLFIWGSLSFVPVISGK